MGFRQPVRRSTLADATKGATGPCWPSGSPRRDAVRSGVGPDQYRLHRPSLCACRSFRGRTSAPPRRVKMHTLLDLRGNIPSFIQSRMASCTTFMPSCSCHGAIYVGRGDGLCPPMLHQAGAFFVTRAKSNIDAHVYSAPTDRSTGIICDQTISPASTPVRLPRTSASASRTPSPARRWSSSPTTSRFRPPPSARSTKAAGR